MYVQGLKSEFKAFNLNSFWKPAEGDSSGCKIYFRIVYKCISKNDTSYQFICDLCKLFPDVVMIIISESLTGNNMKWTVYCLK